MLTAAHKITDLNLQYNIVPSKCKSDCPKGIEDPKDAVILGEAIQIVFCIWLSASMC